MTTLFAAGLLGLLGAFAASPSTIQAGSIDVSVDRQVACLLERGDGIHDVHLFLTVKYTNLGEESETYFEEEHVGAIVLDGPTDGRDTARLDLAPKDLPEIANRLRRYAVHPRETNTRPAVLTLTVRNPDTPEGVWSLDPGRHFLRVVVTRMRAAVGDERREVSSYGIWRELMSAVIEVEFAPLAAGRLCRDVLPAR